MRQTHLILQAYDLMVTSCDVRAHHFKSHHVEFLTSKYYSNISEKVPNVTTLSNTENTFPIQMLFNSPTLNT